ncbi:MAG: DUF3298 and DUF4163 domain-containing protein [Clostridia bacterium]|nr:DUF3298 and DUF4163 domain-containing protein [Clostridia bacterium]MDD4387240.1 DUF3298 and DUF4163 domain-containing protein [Clostridia bacterium]
MKNSIHTSANISTKKIKRNFNHKENKILNIDIEYPNIHVPKGKLTEIKINTNYFSVANKFYRYAVNTLLPNAIQQYKTSIKNNYPFNYYDVVMKYTVTLNSNCTLSTYFDQYQYTGGAHGSTLRLSSTHSLQNGNIITLKDLFKNNTNYKDLIIQQLQLEAEQNLVLNPGIYFDNYKTLIAENFNEDSFYLSPKTINYYYQQYEIAPYSTGIVVFSIPYEKLEIKIPQCIGNR